MFTTVLINLIQMGLSGYLTKTGKYLPYAIKNVIPMGKSVPWIIRLKGEALRLKREI